jgi:hypothetical protein
MKEFKGDKRTKEYKEWKFLNESNKAFQIEQDTALTKHLMLTKD